jgi:hypothetical protein
MRSEFSQILRTLLYVGTISSLSTDRDSKGDAGARARRSELPGPLSSISASWYLDALNVTLLIVGIVALYGVTTSFIPTGADVGNWLAIAHERLGRDVMSANVTYLPVFPGLLAGLLTVWGPIAGFDVAAVLTISALAIAVYVCVRVVGRGYALGAAVVVCVAGNQVEAYAWGGFPQLLATAFGVLATFFLLRHHHTRLGRHLWMGLGFVAATVATHALIGGLLVAALILSTGYWIFLVQPTQGRLRAWLIALSSAGLAGLVVLTTWVWVPEGVEPTLNVLDTGRLESLVKAVREAPIPWAIVTLAAIAVLFRRRRPPEVAATVASGVSWAVAGLGFFLATAEPRALMVVQVGVVMSAVVTLSEVIGAIRKRLSASGRLTNARVVGYRFLIISLVALFGALAVSGVAAYWTSVRWYRLVNESELESLDRLRALSRPDDLVLASRGRHTMPVGWWTQGYAQRRSYSGHDTAYLAFPDEREQAELANTFFSSDLSVEAAMALLVRTGADFVAVDRRGPDARWLNSELAQSFTVVDDSSNIVVLEVPQRAGP